MEELSDKYFKPVVPGTSSKTKNYYLRILLFIVIPLAFLAFTSRCENPEVFFRPDLPEKLCSIGIIDIDDTTLRHISFERSYQSEYEDEINDSLRDFSFSISSATGGIFSYYSGTTIKNIKDLRIPDSIVFNPGEKYYLAASERDLEGISAEVIAAATPPEPRLISYERLYTTLPKPVGCGNITKVKTVRIKISFSKNEILYYAILLKGQGGSLSNVFPIRSGFLDFTVVDRNTPGFLSTIKGLGTYHYQCISISKDPTLAYFIRGEDIPGSECQLSLSVQYDDGLSLFDFLMGIDLKVISIPEELYMFEKSTYTYGKISGDPFAEPVYINGNIKGGNGVFALCRSRELNITFSPLFFK